MPLSPYRYSDGHRSSTLLRAVAHLRSQLWAHLTRAPLAPRQSPSAWCWVGGALLGPVVLSKCPRLYFVALCEAEEAPPASSTPRVVGSRFNWMLFWQFLRPHLLALGVAIVVRLSPLLHLGTGQDPELQRDGIPASLPLRGELTGAVRASQGARGARGINTGWLGVQRSVGAGSQGLNL